MSTLGVILALAVVALQGDVPVEGPHDPDPLWGNDVHVWDMGADSSTYVGPGIQYLDMRLDPVSLDAYAIAIKADEVRDEFNVYWSPDNGFDWYLRRVITNERKAYAPNFGITDDGNMLYATASVRASDSTYFLPFRYYLPDFTNFEFNKFTLPAGSDSVCTSEIVENISTGAIWLFGNDIGGNLYLSTSSDDCVSWSDWEHVISNATMHSVASDSAGNVLLAYRDTGVDEIKFAAFTEPDEFELYTIGPCASDATPRITIDQGLFSKIVVAYHNADDEIVISQSVNMGSSWNKTEYGEGRYPYIDIGWLTSACGLSFLNPAEQSVYVATASSVSQLFSASPYPVSDAPAFTMGPAVIRHDPYSDEHGLLYMRRTENGRPKDLWYDSSLISENAYETASAISRRRPISVYPNPSPGTFSVSFQLPEPQQAALSIYSADGRLVSEVFSGVTSGEDVDVARELPAGVYTVVLRTDEGVSSRRMVSL